MLFMGYGTILSNGECQSIYDQIAGTFVVRWKPELRGDVLI
jgi:hypothetical protein